MAVDKRGKGEPDPKPVTVKLPQALHRKFRIKTVNEGTTMQAELTRMIEEYVRGGPR